MPIRKGRDSHGAYFQPDTHGAKYHYNPKSIASVGEAWRKAVKQTSSMFANGYKVKKHK